MFIDAKIRQVHVSLFDVLYFRVVLVGGESCKSLLQHVSTQGIITGNQDINSQIIFETVNEMRIVNVL